ncbi:DUF2911 domain-containing protein [Salinimicrobium tongyeongense]|uniref:DUF2911 domain-containing protein n=1 Tax=Salinimicrobium tongyeongense TaxID=2809707 RepID=A0ABY6NR95_9FLAO|nr:DUF2911 domain-containing protein [Salinimicrobium tongyeongense]UZH55442.1 DUF2911 domain-containing protein [Salinimicrobium tongyeongense]
MRSTIKKGVLGLFIVLGVVMLTYIIYKNNTKSFSPEDTVEFSSGDLQLEVFYNRPYKKGREIFGGLVPYNEVWRTGANEATTFTTTKDVLIDGSPLRAGTYTLWTIPSRDSWKVIFNSEMYPWGITADKVPSRIPEYDVLTIEVPVRRLKTTVEQFSIIFEEEREFINLNLAWDKTLIRIPIRDPETLERIKGF